MKFQKSHVFTIVQNSQNHVQLIDKFFQNLRRLKFFRKNLKQYK